MPVATIEKELEAIKAISSALEELDTEGQIRVLSYAMGHLNIDIGKTPSPVTAQTTHPQTATVTTPSQPPVVANIRTLKEQKQPTSDVEMATLVAYYLKHVAPESERQHEIGPEDLQKYFVQAGYPLPTNVAYTLPNTKKAGYVENASRGKYAINSVGHNLIAHTLPRGESESVSNRPRKRKTKKKSRSSKARPTNASRTRKKSKKRSKKK